MNPSASTHRVQFKRERASQTELVGRVPRVARLLALAHKIDEMIATGELRDLAHAARICGVTRARLTQISNLLLLCPSVQLAILDLPPVLRGRDPITERHLRAIVAEPEWSKQIAMWNREER